MQKFMRFTIIVLLIVGLVITACSQKEERETGELETGELEYTIIEPNSAEFSNIVKGELGEWYETNYQEEGLHNYEQDSKRYLLLSVGQKPTAGYSINDLKLIGSKNDIEVSAKLAKPKAGEMVAQVLTYPHVLIVIPNDNRQLVFGGIAGNEEKQQELKKDTGRYGGQVDNNSIEIRLSGVPNEIPPKVFRLEDKTKEQLEKLDLEIDQEIGFTYYTNEHGQNIIVEIGKI